MLAFLTLTGVAQAAMFEDDEARRAILDLRQRLEQTNKMLSEENTQLRQSLINLQSQIETLRNDVSQTRGDQERLVRDVSEIQLRQKDVVAGVDERLRKFEPLKVAVEVALATAVLPVAKANTSDVVAAVVVNPEIPARIPLLALTAAITFDTVTVS